MTHDHAAADDSDVEEDRRPTERMSIAESDDEGCDAEELAMRIEIRRQMAEDKKRLDAQRDIVTDEEHVP